MKRSQDADRVFVGTYPDGKSLWVPYGAVKGEPPVFRPGYFYYADDGHFSFQRVAYPPCHGNSVWSSALYDQKMREWDGVYWDGREGEDHTDLVARTIRDLAGIGFDLDVAYWLEGRLDPQGYPAGAYFFKCVVVSDEGSPRRLTSTVWHPELHRRAQERALGCSMRLQNVRQTADVNINITLAAMRRRIIDIRKAATSGLVHDLITATEEADPLLRLGAA